MDGERAHRSGSSELFICFTSRPSSSSSSMRIPSKSIHSPGRTDKFRDGGSSSSSSLHTSLSRRLRHNGSLKGGQASPMFPSTSKKKGCAFDTPEPTSPKVTCIGQVRVKTKKQGKKIRARSKKRGELSFRKTQEGNDHQAAEDGRLERRHQRWVSLPLSICEALRTFGADFNCFQPCGGRSSCGSSGEDRDKGEKRSTTTTTGTCGAVFARWLMALQEGEEEKRRELQEQVALAVEDRGPKEEADDAKRGGHCAEKVLVEEDETVPVCIPPKNALLLMRCRSEPFRMSSYAQRFWESPVPKDAEEVLDDQDEEEEEGDEDDDPCEEGELNVEQAEEGDLDEANVELEKEQKEEVAMENIAFDGALQGSEVELMETEVETGEKVERARKEEEESVEKVSATELGEETVTGTNSSPEFGEEPVTGKSSSPEFVEEPVSGKSSSPEFVEEPVVEEGSTPESMESEVEEIAWGEALDETEDAIEENEENGELQPQRSEQEEEEEVEKEEDRESLKTDEEEEKEKTEGETRSLLQEPEEMGETDERSDQSQVKVEWNEAEGRVSCSSSSSTASSVRSEELVTSTCEGEPTGEQTSADVKEEKSTAAEGVEKEEDGERGGGGGDEEGKEESDKSLPDCLLLMLCEPKLSMEVSKETWVCSTDFLRWRPERKPKATKEGTADDRRRLSTDSNSGKPPPPPLPAVKPNPSYPPPSAPSMAAAAAAVEEKLVKASENEPFGLTRCKSEPMRSSAKLAPEACFWKSRKLQQHPAAGIGF
ncbi:uncharacterized protein [Aristolochia californica]|uniref:uncharacterized protein n=1 Tax=Aristolochia californica TaxID=171875 RepID=UPI0035E26E1B